MYRFAKLYCSLLLINCFSSCCCNKYCGPEICNNNNQHTLCKFQSEDPARHCIDHERTVTTEKEKKTILDKLNSRRNKVASGDIRSLPSAENMMKLEWNEELEMSAQRWANQCVKHSVPDIKDTCRDLGQVFVGQNIATIYGDSPGLSPVSLVDVWYMELLNVNESVLSQYQPSAEAGYSHYEYLTQLMWAESTQVGCGGVKFKERIQESSRVKKYIYRLVCNFAPGGNRLNHTVYTKGVPCSQCESGYCDTVYKSLCNSKTSTDEGTIVLEQTKLPKQSTEQDPILIVDDIKANISEVTEVVETVPLDIKQIPIHIEQTVNEEVYTPFDYFSHLHQFTAESLSTAPNTVSCKDILAVDDFVELLKKKLSTDPMFKEILHTTPQPFHNDGGYTDASVAALVSRIYSKKVPPTTTKSSASDFVNSTLLVDLVEAVIFRKSDKIRNSGEIKLVTESAFGVSPVRIQPEFAEIKLNTDFTGHYFFPEDDDNTDDVSSETTESYDDTSNIPISDVVLEIEDFKRNRATRDFLDEILESESVSESTTSLHVLSPGDINLYKSGHSSMKKFLEEISEKKYKTLV